MCILVHIHNFCRKGLPKQCLFGLAQVSLGTKSSVPDWHAPEVLRNVLGPIVCTSFSFMWHVAVDLLMFGGVQGAVFTQSWDDTYMRQQWGKAQRYAQAGFADAITAFASQMVRKLSTAPQLCRTEKFVTIVTPPIILSAQCVVCSNGSWRRTKVTAKFTITAASRPKAAATTREH